MGGFRMQKLVQVVSPCMFQTWAITACVVTRAALHLVPDSCNGPQWST